MKKQTILLSSGKAVIDRAEGGVFKKGDRIILDVCNSMNREDWQIAKIVKIYYYEFKTGTREMADVILEVSNKMVKGRMTMFFERNK